MEITEGKAYPLGATIDDGGVNFALFSAHATQVILCLFDEEGRQELYQLPLPMKTQDIWHGYVTGASSQTLYGYRVDGPFQPLSGHRFNRHKLLLDPYAKQLVGPRIEHTSLYAHQKLPLNGKHNTGHEAEHEGDDLSFDSQDSAPYMPKCKVVDHRHLAPIPLVNKVKGYQDKARPLSESIFYELHVKGFTQRHPKLPESIKGTFLGLCDANVIQYLVDLGVTCVELMPVQSFFDEAFLHDKALTNYWGYNSIGFFTPHHAYLVNDDVFEFRHMVTELHKAGIEVILDVVYNHSAEGNRLGPCYSFKGIDNLSYYRLVASEPRYFINDTGCGNSLNLAHPRVMQLVTDSLRYWVEIMGVDGFRFDLASTLGREVHGFDSGAGFFDAIAQDPILSQVKLIAEPWDLGPGGYQLGQFPIAWSEWNDRYRDAIRRFWRGDAGMLPEFARRFHGSSDLFEHSRKPPSSSINFITCHDGLTLFDLVSYNNKHNEANGEDNRDGRQENFSHNYGEEGPTDDQAINQVRARQCRNLLTTLLLSQGVPLLLAGDEVGRTQMGNNNSYCQDNRLSWRDWTNTPYSDAMFIFTQKLIQIRKRFPLLCHYEYVHNSINEMTPGLDWYCRQGLAMTKQLWGETQTRTLSLVISGKLEGEENGQQALLLLLNNEQQSLEFTLPTLIHFHPWDCLLHSQDHELDVNDASHKVNECQRQYQLQDRSLMLFHAKVIGDKE
ncbi:glycogen debranching protein GlgX [Shewanella surugensis]|uniref:Glycogen debranching protein GlgX n=1 Tax=Shewanella surugensis TaxID=212020 RepID=A0ABT0LGY3_9GAMM|nr:glycogen debranching protein GlgX [Shewanella surugensis]MCL1126625.1 glycogen debranching protein GlgX [Shewanella surugensis]